jgi:hypothetical protein
MNIFVYSSCVVFVEAASLEGVQEYWIIDMSIIHV